MASTEQYDMQGFKTSKVNQLMLTASSPTVTGATTIPVALTAQHRRQPVIRESGGASLKWDVTMPWKLVQYTAQEHLMRRVTATDAIVKRFPAIDSSIFPVSGPPMMLTFDGIFSHAAAQTCKLGLIVNSTAVNNNANPLVTLGVANGGTLGFSCQILINPHATSLYTSSRGVCWTRTASTLISPGATVVGAAAVMPNAAITGLTLTATFSAVTYITELRISNASIWELKTGNW